MSGCQECWIGIRAERVIASLSGPWHGQRRVVASERSMQVSGRVVGIYGLVEVTRYPDIEVAALKEE